MYSFSYLEPVCCSCPVITVASEKCKSKPQWGTISRQSEWLLSKSLQIINAGDGVENPPTLLVGLQDGAATMENSMKVPQKTKHRVTILSSNPTPPHQFSSVAQLCPTLCYPMNRSTPGLPVHCQLPEFIQTHVHRVGDAIQPSHPLSSPSPPAPNPSQHRGLFQWVNSLHEVAKVLEFQL